MLQRKQPHYIRQRHTAEESKATINIITQSHVIQRRRDCILILSDQRSKVRAQFKHLQELEDEIKVCFLDTNRRKGLCDAGQGRHPWRKCKFGCLRTQPWIDTNCGGSIGWDAGVFLGRLTVVCMCVCVRKYKARKEPSVTDHDLTQNVSRFSFKQFQTDCR